MITSHTIIGNLATGSAGSAGVTTTSPNVIVGRVVGLGVTYLDSPPAGTTDVTIRTKGVNGGMPVVTLLSVSNAATDLWVQPHVVADDVNGADIAATYTVPVIADQVEVVLAQANAGDSVNVVLVVER